ncbi:MAG: hypothetical protein JWN68_3588 [Nocardioides sp.]|uniref:hypothetical protein n=1 Tax=Nocardioides sp. TaxID=35761 RepID=UPI0026260F7E|nr:hypothetical protein [Nocardioides sp.]MCW2835635.1 hypothetical protein [Nocardioides sp.]
MLVSPRTPKRRRSSGPATAIVGVLLMTTAACSADPEADKPSTESTEATVESTPLAAYDTSEVTVVRAAFCDRISDSAIAVALGSAASDEHSWQPGGRLPGSKDIGNEFGCSWTAGQVTARAWVFAPPITAERAEDLVSESVGPKCTPRRSAPPLGGPGLAQSCRLNTGAGPVGISGLVGDAWVSCEINGRDDADVGLVGEWCVVVLEALRGT